VGGAGVVTGLGVIFVGDGVSASWCGVQIGFSSWRGQGWVFKSRCAGRGVAHFFVSILRWSMPPQHVKWNPLWETYTVSS
jgi:hypothetical protein